MLKKYPARMERFIEKGYYLSLENSYHARQGQCLHKGNQGVDRKFRYGSVVFCEGSWKECNTTLMSIVLGKI